MAEWFKAAAVDELPAGENIVVEVEFGFFIAVFNINGDYYAVEDSCSHDDSTLADGDLHGCEIACPRHGARFDLRTGKALSLPAVKAIDCFAVKVEDGVIYVDVDGAG